MRRVLAVARYIYRYGIVDFACRIASRAYRPLRNGCLWMFRHGVYRVGTLWAIPTMKSWRVWRLLRRAGEITIAMTLPAGGGSESYLKGRIEKDCAENHLFIVVKPTASVGVLKVMVYKDRLAIADFVVSSLRAFSPLKTRCCHILVNELVFWNQYVTKERFVAHDYGQIVDEILMLKRYLCCTMSFMVHDYFSICPRYALVGSKGVYCGAERNCDKCSECLGDLNCAPTEFDPKIDAVGWRCVMRQLLVECDEVRCFSEDSIVRMRNIYPECKFTIVPHEPLVRFDPLLTQDKSKLVIGVVGTMNHIKGFDKVCELARRIEKLGIQIVVLGSTERKSSACLSGNIVLAGSYRHSDLPSILVKYGVNLLFFSSIWPETFSYVVQEVLMLRLPIVCYNIGAPMDKVSVYDHGLVVDDFSVETTWHAIRALAMKEGIRC